jgi:hypothetical protein
VISPTRFDLKNSSILLTPVGGGYRISNGDVKFSRDFGSRLGYFFGADNKLDDRDNGYRDIPLFGAPFPFFGIIYETIFIGTNGYITFTRGDATARISPTARRGFAANRTAVADFEVVTAGRFTTTGSTGITSSPGRRWASPHTPVSARFKRCCMTMGESHLRIKR